MKRYVRRRYTVPERLQDLAIGRLWLMGTLGVETEAQGEMVLTSAYFEAPAPPDAVVELLGGQGLRRIAEEAVADADWLAAWREQAQPFPAGKRWLLDPREPGAAPPPAAPGRILLRLPARRAFGTGGHESTRLVLELLEGLELSGRRVLDLGTGTGVLAFAALALGAGRVVAFDLDPAAALLAALNARLNRARPLLFAGPLAAIRARTRFDLLLANVVPEEFAADLPRLARRLAPRGRAVFSGILRERGRRVLAALRAAGFRRLRSRFAGEWVAYLCGAA